MQDFVTERFFEAVEPSKCNQESFNSFLRTEIGKLLEQNRDVKCQHFTATGESRSLKIIIVSHKITTPRTVENDGTSRLLSPHEARIRGLDYSGSIYVDILIDRGDGKPTKMVDVYFGRIPIMLFTNKCHVKDPSDRQKYKECQHDVGGYFIIKGTERVLVSQKVSGSESRITTFKKNQTASAMVKSACGYRQFICTMKYFLKSPVTILFPRLLHEVNLLTLLYLLGCDNLKSLFSKTELDLLRVSFAAMPKTKEAALKCVKVRNVYSAQASDEERVNEALETMLVPHIPIVRKDDGTVDYTNKCCYLIYMLKKMLAVQLGNEPPTDRDSLISQRVQMSFTLISKLFFQLLVKWRQDMEKIITKYLSKGDVTDKKLEDIISNCNIITDGFNYAFATGNWLTSYIDNSRLVGVSQVLQRKSYKATLSHLLMLVNSNFDKDMKVAGPRNVHGTHFGRICSVQSPEGASIGLVLSFSMAAYVSLQTDVTPISGVIKQYLLPITFENIAKGKPVFVNGNYVGNTLKLKTLVSTVREGRRSGQFSHDISVSGTDCVHVSTSYGRVCRPLIILKKGKLPRVSSKWTWGKLLINGVVEYVDAEEESECYVAFFEKDITSDHTHLEISNTFVNSFNSASIPFSDRNPAPRNLFQSAMGKQYQNISCLSANERVENSKTLYYTQRPLIDTTVAKKCFPADISPGANVILACMCFGDNQEDSLIFNKASIERGLFRSDKYSRFNDSLSNTSKSKSTFKKPVKKRRTGDFGKLDTDGLVAPGTEIKASDCIFGKETTFENQKEDSSFMSPCGGRVDKTFIYQSKGGAKSVKTVIRESRAPQVGDKFSSRHGQKGTIGSVLGQENMPHTMDGITPDIIINPHAIPSRMTIGHLIEALGGKVRALSCAEISADPFAGSSVEEIMAMLHESGFNKKGDEMMMNGITGEMYKVKIFIAPMLYQRLTHDVLDKVHARNDGKKNALTHQPIQGRSNGGGLRFGNMEKDAVTAHACPNVTLDRLLYCSDVYTMRVCPHCQMEVHRTGNCPRCDEYDLKNVKTPYAFVLMAKELASMGVQMKYKV